MNIKLSPFIQKKLDAKIPKNKQEEFVERVVEGALKNDRKLEKYYLATDGGARGNPGPAACGAVLFDDQGQDLRDYKKYLGKMTNNQAEYWGVIMGLEGVLGDFKNITELTVCSDSELLVKQVTGEYRVKNINLKTLVTRVFELVGMFNKVEFKHIRREKNKKADALVNEVLDKQSKK